MKLRYVGGVVLAGIVLWWGIGTNMSQESSISPVVTASLVEPIKVATTSTTVGSGVVVASDQVVIRARKAGVVQVLSADAGDMVGSGAVLAVVTGDTDTADQALVVYQSQLAMLGRTQTELMREREVRTTTNSALIARTTATATESSVTLERSTAAATVAHAARGTITDITTALTYVDDNRSLFSRASMDLYNQTVVALYGQMPKYLQGGIAIPGKNPAPLQLLLTAEDEAVVMEAGRLETVLKQAIELFELSEQDVLDTAEVSRADERRVTYLATRAALLSRLTELSAARSAYATTVISGPTLVTVDELTVGIRENDQKVSTQLQENEQAITSATLSLAEAEMARVAAALAAGVTTAPQGGQIAKRYVSAGTYVTPGTPLFLLSGTDVQEVVIALPVMLASAITVDTPVTAREGYVGHISAVTVDPLGRQAAVTVTMDDTVALGTSLSFDLPLLLPDTAGVIPRQAVYFMANGPHLKLTDGHLLPITIIEDIGTTLLVSASAPLPASVQPVTSLRLRYE